LRGTIAGMRVIFLSALALCAAPALAQKSANTLRIPFVDPIQVVSYYLDPKTETIFTSEAVYDNLIFYNEDKGVYEPLLAKAWRRINETTLEFDLREDVRWHDGQPFTADDVVYTFSWLTDPKTVLRFKSYWEWIDRAEKIGPHKVRIIAKAPTPYDMARLAYLTTIVSKHAHGGSADKMGYGRKPVGTGMFRAVSVDPVRGIVLERNRDYRHGGSVKPASNIDRVIIRQLPDTGTRVAEFMAGQLDLMVRDVPLEQALELRRLPGREISTGQGTFYNYIAINASGRSGLEPLKNPLVRRAMMMAIDRDALYKLVTGPFSHLPRPQSMCWRSQAGCDYSVPLPAYDPAGARKLLAEAGYGAGFDLMISTFTNEGVRSIAEAIAGQYRAIGIRASIEPMTLGAYRKKQAEGRLQVFAGAWPGGGMPDITGTLGFLYNVRPATDYHNDDELKKLAIEADRVIDPEKRKALGRRIFDMGLERGYFMPTTPIPAIVVHTNELVVKAGTFRGQGVDLWNIRWR